MTRQAIGENLAARLYAAETAIDLALIETAARADAYLSAITGRRAFDGAAGAVSALSAARSHVGSRRIAPSPPWRANWGSTCSPRGPSTSPATRPPFGGSGGGGDGGGAHPDMVNKPLPYITEPC